MEAGKLTERITIQKPQAGTDAVGQPLMGWSTYFEAWANVRHLSGLETIKADAAVSTVKASIRIRRRPGRFPNAGMRIIHDGRVYNIEAVLPGQLRYNKHIDMICTTTGETA